MREKVKKQLRKEAKAKQKGNPEISTTQKQSVSLAYRPTLKAQVKVDNKHVK
jgi:hypothetical protein